MMRRVLLLIFLLSGYFGVNAQTLTSGCPEVLDQQLTVFNLGTVGVDQWQSFTAGMSGRLTRLEVRTNSRPSYSYQLTVYAGTGTVGAVLYTGSFNNPGICNNWLISNLGTTTGPVVSSGNIYTFRIQSNAQAFFSIDAANAYANGTYYSDVYGPMSNYDLLFKTWVQSLAVPAVTISPVTTLSTCPGGSVNLTASAGTYTYQWQSSTGPIPGATANSFSAATGNTYAVMVTNTLTNCFNTSNSLSVSALPTPVVTNTVTLCRWNTATLTSLPAGTFTWSTGANTPTIAVTPLTNTNYTVIAAGTNGCQSSTITNVQIAASPSLNINGLTATVNLGSCSTILSNWATTYFYFNDPLPPNARITGYTFNFDAVDQGWGGTGCYLATKISGEPVGGTNISNVVTNYTYYVATSAPTYTYGGTNALGLSFCGWGGWQAFTYNTKVIIHYDIGTRALCPGKTTTLTATGANSYTWSGGISNAVPFIPTASQVYTVTGSMTNGCTASRQVTITSIPPPTITVTGPSTVCAGNPVVLSASGANTYSWTSGALPTIGQNYTFTPISTNNYSVSGTNTLTGCSSTYTSSISALPLPTVTVGNYSLCLGDSLNVVPSGAAFYTFLSGSALSTPSVSGTFSISGTSSVGCVSSNTAISAITVYSLPIISISNGVICSGQTFTMAPTGAVSYSFVNGGPVVSPSVTTSYSVYGVSNQGCASQPTAVATVSVFSNPTITVTGPSTVCAGNPVVLSAAGANTYSWTSGALPTIGQNYTFTPISTNNYSVSGTNTLTGCSSTYTSSISALPLPTVTVGNYSLCLGSTLNVVPSGAAFYTFLSGSALSTPSVSGTFSIIGTSSLGCVSSNTAVSSITVYSLPIISISNGGICRGQTFTIAPTGAVSYSFVNGGPVVSPSVTTSYSVYGVSNQGCVSQPTAVATVSVFSNPTITVTGPSTVCAGNPVVLSASGANTYSWTSGALPTIGQNYTLTPISTNNYSVSGTNTLTGCSSTYTSSISALPLPTVTVGNYSLCLGDSLNVVPSGAAVYTFLSGSALSTPSVSGTFSIIGTSSLGCVSSNTAVSAITVYSLPIISISNGGICRGQTFTIAPTGAVSYSFVNGGPVVSPSVTTSYSVYGVSNQGCVSQPTAVATVSVFSNPTITVTGPSTVCAGNPVVLSAAGANTYSWTSGALPTIGQNYTLTPISTNNYSVSGTNTLTGCSSTYTSSISALPLPTVTVGNYSLCLGDSLNVVPSGAAVYTFLSGSALSTPSVSGTFSIIGTSSLGCVSSNTAVSSITVYSLPIISISNGGICRGQTFTIAPTGAVSYSFVNGGPVVSPSVTTSYSVYGVSNQGCVSQPTAVATVSVFSNPTITVTGPSTVCAGNPVVLSAAGANTYSWTSGALPTIGQNYTLTPISTNNYSVSGTNTLTGCSSTYTSSISALPLPTVTVGNYSLCLGDSLNVVPSGAAFYTFLSGSALSTPSVSGTFSIIGTSSLGCVSSNTAVSAITVYSLPIISISNGGICSGQTFTIAPTGAVSYTFVNGGPVVSPSVTTSYSVYGASNQGCVSQPTAVATVSIFPNPTITVASGSICSGEIFTIQPSGALTYTISGGTSTVSPLANTVYSISGTNSLGCNSVQDGTCQVTVDLTPTITVSNGTICAGQSFTFTHTGAVTYTYSGGSAVVSPSVTSVYQISGFSASGCVSSPYLATITVNQLPQLNAVFIPSVPCQGDSITPIASGASTLIWSGGLVNGTTVDLPITPQQFTITGIDINGCINSTVTTLVSRALPQIKVSSSNSVSCETALVILTASGASSYTWQNSISGNTVSFSPLTTSNYSLIGTDEFGCRNSASFTQSVIPCSQNFTAYATVTDVECFKKNNGKIQAFANADYDQKTISYKWSNGFCPEDTCTIANNLPAGIYKLKVLLTYTLNNILVKKDSLLLGPFSVADEKGPCNITIFNGISISSGNDNDHFYIKNIEMYPQNKVTVFNRWGQLIKEINGYNNKDVVWPGTAEIENLQPSTYFYIIDLADGSTPIKGWIEVTKR